VLLHLALALLHKADRCSKKQLGAAISYLMSSIAAVYGSVCR
jgi:hypothetical protein